MTLPFPRSRALACLLSVLAPLSALATATPAYRGLSGALRAAVVAPGSALDTALPLPATARARLAGQWGAREDGGLVAPSTPGAWAVELAEAVGAGGGAARFTLLTPARFDGTTTHLNGYHIGRYPARAAGKGGAYAPPELFVEVTRTTQHTWVSEHFQLKQFLTKDQQHVWPKYVVLDLRLVDKLELVLQELRAQGFPARRLHVMSAFRTPQYNAPGVGKGGRATFSRHTYGDAADVWLDDDGDGTMDDLNRDGRVDVKDAHVLAAAVDRVEERHPSLVGGHGVYKANRVHGPFVHVDVRGTPARWAKR